MGKKQGRKQEKKMAKKTGVMTTYGVIVNPAFDRLYALPCEDFDTFQKGRKLHQAIEKARKDFGAFTENLAKSLGIKSGKVNISSPHFPKFEKALNKEVEIDCKKFRKYFGKGLSGLDAEILEPFVEFHNGEEENEKDN